MLDPNECERCGKPIADAEWSHEPGCECAECLAVCFGSPGSCEPAIDWRARYFARDEVVKAARVVAAESSRTDSMRPGEEPLASLCAAVARLDVGNQ